MKKNNYISWIIVAILVIVALFFIFKEKKPTDNTQAPNENQEQQNIDNNEPESSQDTSGQSGAASISYTDALVKYKDRRLQFNASCQATPSSVTYKDNTGIMLDNRSSQSRTIKVGQSYTIKPYGFKIVTLPDTYLKSKTILVDCGSLQNVATILVQE